MFAKTKFKAVALAAACAVMLGAAPANAAGEAIRIGTEAAFAPFEFMDDKTKELTGFDLDLIKAIFDEQGLKSEISSMTFDGLIPAILTGMLDVAIAGFTITEERAKKVSFSEPYYKSGLGVMINVNAENPVKSVEDLDGRTICCQIGTSGAMYASELEDTEVKQYNTATEAYLELSNGACDASVNDKPVHEYYLNVTGDKNLTMLPMFITSEDYGIVVAKDNEKLLKTINEGLEKIRSNGTYDKIYEKWFGHASK